MKLQSVIWRNRFKAAHDFSLWNTVTRRPKKATFTAVLTQWNFFYSAVKEAGLPNCQSEIQEGKKSYAIALEETTAKLLVDQFSILTYQVFNS